MRVFVALKSTYTKVWRNFMDLEVFRVLHSIDYK